jgi:5-hydroxyisourate hydrolase
LHFSQSLRFKIPKSEINPMSISTHILDTSKGRPAADVTVTLFQQQGDTWKQLARGTTDANGRLPDLLKEGMEAEQGVYRLRFETKAYFEKLGLASFYPFIEITFVISTNEHYHIPLLITPHGYSTYRGS